MSVIGSPAPSEAENKKIKVNFQFCQECSNLLYPKEDRATAELLFVCKACHAVTKAESACTWSLSLGSNVQETAGVTTDVANDPTLPRAKQECPRCKEDEVVYFQSQQRGADTGMTLYYVCVNCNNVFELKHAETEDTV